MADQAFGGDKKAPMVSPLAAVEKRFIQANWSRFPAWIEGYHLTMLTIAWTLGMVLFGWLASGHVHWLWASSLMLFLQWFTDSFDGALGRNRGTGLIRWGFYMDHFLDFMFMSAIFIGYAFLVPPVSQFWLFLFMLVYGAMMVNSFLTFGATNEFQITYLGTGPTEIRLFFIMINTGIIYGGTGWFMAALPWAVGLCFSILCLIVCQTQRRIWDIDMANKAASGKG